MRYVWLSIEISNESLAKAGNVVKAVRQGHEGVQALSPARVSHSFYTGSNPIDFIPFYRKIQLLQKVDKYARSKKN